MLELVNRARANPAAEAVRFGIGLNDGLAAGTISAAPKPPLAMQPLLVTAARGHSAWMIDADLFSHTGLAGSDAGTRMTDAGFIFEGSWTWAENIAGGVLDSTKDTVACTILRHEDLFKSASHRKNLCAEGLRLIGIGAQKGNFQGWDSVFITQDFAASNAYPQALALGVVYKDKNKNGVYDAGEGIKGVDVRPRGGSWYAVTSTTGGYSLPGGFEGKKVSLDFSGGGLPVTITRTVSASAQNVKVDLAIPPGPQIQIKRGSKIIAANGTAALGSVAKSTATTAKTFTISNIGDGKLTGIKLTKSGSNPGDFVISKKPAEAVKIGGSTTFKIVFKPKAKGTRSAVLRVASNDPYQNPLLIKVSGKGL